MNKIKYLMIFALLLQICIVFSQNVAVCFKDASGSPLTQAVLNPECQAQYGQDYSFTFPTTANRWRFQWYKDGGDNVISPLDYNGNPTGDDAVCTGFVSPGNTTGQVALGPTQLWMPSAATFQATVGSGNTKYGDKVYLRIFNASTIAAATKSIVFTSLYTIPSSAGTYNVVPYIPTYAWGPWVAAPPPRPNPVVLVSPANNATGLGYSAGQVLTWSYGGRVVPDPINYKVYFGTDGSGISTPTNIFNGLSQSETTKATGVLLPYTTYFWQIVPYNSSGDALNCPIWSFTTRAALPPVVYIAPLNGASIQAQPSFPFNVQLSWEGYVAGGIKDIQVSYKVYVGPAADNLVLVNTQSDTTYNVAITDLGDYYWKVVAYYSDPGAKSAISQKDVAVRASYANTYTKAGPLRDDIWHFTVTEIFVLTYDVEITSEPSGASIQIDTVPTGQVTPHTFTFIAGTTATFTVEYIALMPLPPTSFTVTNLSAPASHHFILVPAPPPPPDSLYVIGGGPASGGANVASGIDLYENPTPGLSDPVFLLLPNQEFLLSPVVASFAGVGITDLVVTVGPGSWFGLIYYSGSWHFANLPEDWPLVVAPGNTGTMTFLNVDFGAKGDVVLLLNDGDNPLPVELSSFTAVLTSQYFINLSWVTESETQALGFNVLRSVTPNVSDANQINQFIIPATNTSQQHAYTVTDTEDLMTNQTYYYWLENVDIGGGNNLFGPVSATISGQPTPEIPSVTSICNAYPNPVRTGALVKIDVNIKADEVGTINIFNIRGQLVKNYSVLQGEHKLTWDTKGCGSGIYFYKLSTPTMNTTRKIVMFN